ncbi:molybdopterin-containing oxidoreductase family protein [Geotalea uraniireducens]|uniref:Nitrate reductase n=1 Tax=Geotalea uraniireducens (strain Rf4) TaxID=351605 RepID=A5G583_GEOUR|nr:molybdopterin-dependent oxidoreductase [Geotalea uraniireducens]ABQ26951.1 Nitrate reductase [Geotalea uraniireducens Rf4]
MKRRTFLQLSGMTAAGTVLSGCQSGNEKLIPYLVPPDEGVTPGKADYYASSCRFCPAGCGILVRVSEGRAKKIEGNPAHPVNRGKLCAMGQAVLQELYHPDRVPQPLKRSGPRGSGAFTRISWEESLELLAGQLRALQREKATDRLALVTPQLNGTLVELTTRFMRVFGSPHHLSFDLLGPDWLRTATRRSFGQPGLPWYDVAETRYLLSFGADFVEHHLSPVQYGYAFGRMRQGRDTVRGHFTYVGGRMSLTGASADRWMPARPGSEGALALGMARLILAESLSDAGSLAVNGLQTEKLLRRLEAYDLPRVAEQTGLPQRIIAEVAREFATTRPALAMAGETVAFQSNGPDAVRAVQMLNLLVGNLNRPGGVYPDGGSRVGPENSFTELLSLVAAMRDGRFRVAMIHGDPVHAIPPATGFQEALARVPFIVSFSSLMDDTALQADLILPDHAALESWGDVIPLAGTRDRVIGLMQPVVTPLFDTRQFPDVLMAMADKLGGKTAAFPYQSYQEMLKGTMEKRVGRAARRDFETVWVELLRQGGLFETRQGQEKGYRRAPGSSLPNPAEPRFAGDEKRFPLHLLVYPSIAFYDGRGAPLPWLQQLPDPMTTVVWDSWVEINPRTAAEMGIGFGDLVEVTSPQGAMRLPAVIYPGIRPDMVAIPLGQGHRGMGRYARGRGSNPLVLLALITDGTETRPAWHATRVRLTRISEKGELVTAGHPQGSYRSELIEI